MANEKTPLLNSGETGGATPKVGFSPSQEYVHVLYFLKSVISFVECYY